MRIINEPEVSRAIGLSYKALVVFIAALTVFFAYAAFFTPMGTIGIAAAIVSTFVGMIISLIVASLYGTRYILTNEELIIKTTKLIGGGKIIPLRTVKSVERTLYLLASSFSALVFTVDTVISQEGGEPF